MIEAPGGLFEIEAADYHADPAPVPSLNNSTIGPLLNCPRLAFERHPRLNVAYVREESKRLDLGTVAHELALGKGRGFEVLPFPDFRTNAAKEAREAAYGAGKTPILAYDFGAAQGMVDALGKQLEPFGKDVRDFLNVAAGQSEIAMIWQDDHGAWGRSLIDRLLSDDQWTVIDYKTVGRSANPDSMALSIHVVDHGYDTQFAMIERGLTKLYPQLGGRIKFRWVFQEIEPPYLVSVVEPDAATMMIAHKKVERAFQIWRECLASGEWPAYPQKIVPLRHAEHLASRWLEREIEEFDAAREAVIQLKRNPGRPSARSRAEFSRRGKRIAKPRTPPEGSNPLGAG